MKLTSDYRNILATFQSEINYSQIPATAPGVSQYFFTVGPLEYKVQFDTYDRDTYSMIFRPIAFQGTPEEKVAFYKKATGETEQERHIDRTLQYWLESRDSMGVIGAGSAFKVISNVISVVDRFFKNMESRGDAISCLHFMADNEEESRVRVYSKIAETYRKQGYQVNKLDGAIYTQYTICQPEESLV
jgi:hypothetical protein